MPNAFVTGAGQSIQIGREIGKGGEGAVYEVINNPKLAAKIYNFRHAPNTLKQAKLRFMVMTADSGLLNFAAWPQTRYIPAQMGPLWDS